MYELSKGDTFWVGGLFPGELVSDSISVVTEDSRTMAKKFELNLPEYPGYAQIVELPSNRL